MDSNKKNCNAISEPCSPGPPTTSRILKSSTDTKDLPGSRSSCHVQSTRNSFYPIESIGKSQPISESEPSTTAGIVQTKAQTLASAQMVSFHYANTTPSNLISKTKTSSEVAILPPPYPVTTQNNRGPPPPNRSMTPYSLYQFDANTTRWRQFSYPMGNSENHLNSTMSEFDIDSGIRSRSVTDFVDSPMDATYSFQEVREVNITRHEEEKFGMKVDRIGQSLFITMILKSSCASNAGLKVGDEVIRINDKPVNRLPIEEIISLIRGSESTVKIAYKPRAVIARVRDVVLKKVDGRVGIRLQRRADGLFIDVVVENSPAIKAGLKEGDELLRINDRVVIDWSQERATRYLKELPNDCDILLYIREMLPMAHVSGHHGATPCLQLTPNSTPFCFTGPSEPNSPLLAKKSTCGST